MRARTAALCHMRARMYMLCRTHSENETYQLSTKRTELQTQKHTRKRAHSYTRIPPPHTHTRAQHGVYRRKPRLFPSSMVANAQRVESIFLRHYRQNVLDKVQQVEKVEELPKPKRPVRRPAALEPEEQATSETDKAALAQQQQQQQQQGQLPGAQSQSHPSEEQPDQQEPPQHQKSSSDRKESRRATRSTGKGLDDWLKIPVEATVRVSTGSLETLDGIVYVSVETGRE